MHKRDVHGAGRRDDDHAEADACLAHAPVSDDEATEDDHLPPATGGVARR